MIYRIRFTRTVEVFVEADNLEKARAGAEYEADSGDFAVDADCEFEVRGEYVALPTWAPRHDLYRAIKTKHGVQFLRDVGAEKALAKEKEDLKSDAELMANIEAKRRLGLPVWTDVPTEGQESLGIVGWTGDERRPSVTHSPSDSDDRGLDAVL